MIFNKNTGEKLELAFKLSNNGKTLIINKNEDFKTNNEYVLFINNDLEDDQIISRLKKVLIMEIHC